MTPYKFNGPRRHKVPKARHKVTNRPEYGQGAPATWQLTARVTPEALAAWHSPKRGRPGRSREYSDLAIETGQLPRLALPGL